MTTDETHTAQVSYDRATAEMFDTERRIQNLTRWHKPEPDSVDGKLLAAFQLKRERLTAELKALKAILPIGASHGGTRIATSGNSIAFRKDEWKPIGTHPAPLDPGELPAFLRRSPTRKDAA